MKYSCKYCDYKCQRKNELQIHKNDEHKIRCDLCKFKKFSEDDFEECMKTFHDICQAKEHFCDKNCNAAEGIHICFDEDFDNWKVKGNFINGETLFKCLDCGFKVLGGKKIWRNTSKSSCQLRSNMCTL
jgi:hypothetical protein